MAAKPRTSTSMLSALAGLAEAGRFDVKAVEVAMLANVTKETAQRFGRENSPIDVAGSRWCASYSRGRFKIREREGYREPAPVVAPDWFELPTDLTKDERYTSGFDIGQRRVLTYRFVQECIDGHIALAPWQRPAVWTEDQQVALLDSMMRGITIGALTMWHRPMSESVADSRPLPGCAMASHGHITGSRLIVDGQQRATTLVLAALGGLDHWRWNGHEWTQGKGFMTPRIAVLGPMQLGSRTRFDWESLLGELDRDFYNAAYHQSEAIQRTDLDMIVLGGTADDMIETYRRLATNGTPHSPMDLAIMEGWLERRRSAEGRAE